MRDGICWFVVGIVCEEGNQAFSVCALGFAVFDAMRDSPSSKEEGIDVLVARGFV